MSSWRERAAVAVLAAAGLGLGVEADAQPRPDLAGIGRPATPAEVAAWDIDVRPDFRGLPAGRGSVAQGQVIWEAQCASCHGVFGESGEVFAPIVGGTTADDLRTGRVARLTDGAYPGRTTLMKLASVATLWDYIRRAMPWTQPKSLSADEVYAVTAYLLNLGGVLPDDYVMSDRNIAEVQQRLPNRNGLTTRHALWPGAELGGSARPDVQGSACRSDCRDAPTIASSIPDFARPAHGNLATQNRLVGAQIGADTSQPPAAFGAAAAAARLAAAAGLRSDASGVAARGPSGAAPAAASGAPGRSAGAARTTAADVAAGPSAFALAQSNGCVACHGMDNRIVGPALQEIARKYAAQPDAVSHLTAKIRAGGTGVWGSIPMPPQALSEADARAIADWLARGAPP